MAPASFSREPHPGATGTRGTLATVTLHLVLRRGKLYSSHYLSHLESPRIYPDFANDFGTADFGFFFGNISEDAHQTATSCRAKVRAKENLAFESCWRSM